MMADSGARGSMTQIRQLAGMRGLMANTAGKTIEIPIKSNFREGLTVLEYFISSRGARKGLADTALRTADSGYLTRRLVDVSQDVIIREEDCGTTEGICGRRRDGQGAGYRTASATASAAAIPSRIWSTPNTGELLVPQGPTMLQPRGRTGARGARHQSGAHPHRAGLPQPQRRLRHVLRHEPGYQPRRSIVGEAVGIIAAQSIGEPGTQLTMRTFHTGGVAGDDITQGLPRVEELFEARKPKKMAHAVRDVRHASASTRSAKSALRTINVVNEPRPARRCSTPFPTP